MEPIEFEKRKYNVQSKDASAAAKARVAKYDKTPKAAKVPTRDPVLKRVMGDVLTDAKESAIEAARTELLLPHDDASLMVPENDMEKTFKVSQRDLRAVVPQQIAQKSFSLALDQGPYVVDTTRNGRHLVVGGGKGHIAMFDRLTSHLHCELRVNEAVRDVQFLHGFELFAVAQRRFTYIYDKSGIEVHCLRQHVSVSHLDFLPFHFLLVTAPDNGMIKWQDVSTGHIVAEHRTRLGPSTAMGQNPQNAVMHLGHTDGTVTLWTPNLSKAAVSIFTERGSVQDLAVDASGRYMATASLSGVVKIFDLRTYKPLHFYRVGGQPAAVDISQKGVLAVGFNNHVQLYANALASYSTKPYMKHHEAGSRIQSLKFAPYDDVLCVGHANGVANLVVPGAGEPNFDTFVASPYETKNQRREREVQSLLEKVPHKLISLDDALGRMTIVRHAGAKHHKDEVRRQQQQNKGKGEDDSTTTEDDSDNSDPAAAALRKSRAELAARSIKTRGSKHKPSRVAARKSEMGGQASRERSKDRRVEEMEEKMGAAFQARREDRWVDVEKRKAERRKRKQQENSHVVAAGGAKHKFSGHGDVSDDSDEDVALADEKPLQKRHGTALDRFRQKKSRR